MEMDAVTIRLPREMRIALAQIARGDDVSPGQLIRALVNKEIARRHNAKPPVSADERLIAPLRARLAADLAEALCWDDLDMRLKAKGYVLREAGGGLALHSHQSGERVCKASELGFSYSRLMRRFRAPFPGHAHTYLADRFLRVDAAEEEEDFEVIERL